MTKRIRKQHDAWAIVDKYGIQFGTQCDFGVDHEYYQAVFKDKQNARLALRLHSEFYKGCKVVPCTVTFTLPGRRTK